VPSHGLSHDQYSDALQQVLSWDIQDIPVKSLKTLCLADRRMPQQFNGDSLRELRLWMSTQYLLCDSYKSNITDLSMLTTNLTYCSVTLLAYYRYVYFIQNRMHDADESLGLHGHTANYW